MDFAAAGEGDDLNFARHARLKANCRASRDVQAKAKRLVTVKLQCGVDLVKMEVAADLYRPVTGSIRVSRFSFAASGSASATLISPGII